MPRRSDSRSMIIALAIVAFTVPGTLAAEVPAGWTLSGTHPNLYDMEVDDSVSYSGSASATLKSNAEEISGFGTLAQMIAPDDYRGRRIRLSGYMKSRDVADWAGFWMRVDGRGQQLAFDNMENRAVKGTTGWQRYEIVLDVSQEATAISFGFLLSGVGQIWADGLELEIVADDVPVTDASAAGPATTLKNLKSW